MSTCLSHQTIDVRGVHRPLSKKLEHQFGLGFSISSPTNIVVPRARRNRVRSITFCYSTQKSSLASAGLTVLRGCGCFNLVYTLVAAVKMDIVLELCDTFAFDRFWATVLPASSALTNHNATATWSSMRESATLVPKQSWTWEPATSYISFPPSEYAWQSAWPRDKLERQFIELFFITW